MLSFTFFVKPIAFIRSFPVIIMFCEWSGVKKMNRRLLVLSLAVCVVALLVLGIQLKLVLEIISENRQSVRSDEHNNEKKKLISLDINQHDYSVINNFKPRTRDAYDPNLLILDKKSIAHGLIQPLHLQKALEMFGTQGNIPVNKTLHDIGRVYCMVPTVYSHKKFEAWNAILRTWGSRCDVLKFFVDPIDDDNYTKIPPIYVDTESGKSVDIVVLNDMVRKFSSGICSGDNIPCRHIWEKVWRAWVWIGHNDLDKAEWFMKVDDDTFLFPEFLKLFIYQRQWTWRDTHYTGMKLFHHGVDEPLIAGAVTIWSKATVLKAYPHYEKMRHEYGPRNHFRHGQCVDRDGATEERTTSICLREIGIDAEDSWDEKFRERTMVWAVSDSMIKERLANSTGWFFANKPKFVGFAENCCSDTPISFHNYKEGYGLLRINDLLYGKAGEGEDNELEIYIKNENYMAKLLKNKDGKTKSLVRGFVNVNLAKYRQINYFYRIRKNLERFWGPYPKHLERNNTKISIN